MSSVASGRAERVLKHPSARSTGIVYLVYFLTAILSAFLLRTIIVSGDTAATARNILRQESFFHVGFAVGIISIAVRKILSPYIQSVGVVAEALLMLWLLVFGINIQRWAEQASIAGE